MRFINARLDGSVFEGIEYCYIVVYDGLLAVRNVRL